MIPAQTMRVAWASNPKGTPAIWIRDRLEGLFTDDDFADWYPADGRQRLPPAMPAPVSVLQYAENLTDRQAAMAVRCDRLEILPGTGPDRYRLRALGAQRVP
jgi:hypothetical protein